MNELETNFNIKELLFFIRRNIKIMMAVFSLIMIFGCAYILKKKPIYNASGTILIESSNNKSDVFNFSHENKIIEDKIEILKSSTISKRAIKDLISISKNEKLYALGNKVYKPEGFYRKAFEYLSTLGGVLDSKEEDISLNYNSESTILYLAKKLRQSIKIENIRKTNILNISVNSLSPTEAALIVNTFIDAYIDQEKKWANQEINQSITFLESQIEKKELELEEIENQIKTFQISNEIYNIGETSKLLLEQFLDIESKLIQEKINYEDAVNLKNSYLQEESAKNEVSSTRKLELKELKREVNANQKIISERILNIKEELLIKQNALNHLPEETIELMRLERIKNISEQTFRLMMQKLDESKIMFESQTGDAKVVDYAYPNINRVSPKVRKEMMLCIMLGLIAAFSIALFIEQFNTSIKSLEDLEKYGLNVLAIIPSIKNRKKHKKIRKTLKEENKIERHLITLEDPKSPISEAYRTLRTSIMYSDTNTNKTILVSSPGPGEGKTTTVANLALTYANLGKKTLLIDTDLRKPVINKVFSVEKNPGLTNYLINDEKFEVVIKETDIENLHIIPSGIVPPNPSELLDSDSMKTMIDNLKEQYDIILFDTPPIVAVTDALILSKHIDKFILVCRPGVTQKGALERVLKNLDQVNSKINGCVFNAIGDLDSYGSAYYYNYYQYYYNSDN
ncbi:MAG: hypothetical protein CMG25_05000 [Candidatus Marinimicrobia bacterium]|nr:hypothetical protein [Candidatus Neomarinimicrobiota bacterium]|tara:strand:- start:31241 stop:33295 length:2055 start_codon:yes stop_codon:yes gene_type:complete